LCAGEAAGWAAPGEGRLDGALEEALEKMRASLEARSFPDYAEADAAFHLAMVQALGNEILSTVYENLYGLITDVIRLSVRVPSKSLQEGLEEHEALYRALRSGDPERAKAAITGSGRADKAQVGTMVARILGLDGPPRPADAADAVALAICHIWRGGAQARVAQAQQDFARKVELARRARGTRP
jgi:hypothetical protein